MAKLNTINLQVATLHKPELQKPLCPISVPHYGETAAAVDAIYGSYIRRLAFCEAGVMETAARQVRAIPPDPCVPGLRAFDYTPENPEANKLVAGNPIIAIVKEGGGALEKLSKIQARVIANFNKAHRSLVDWHDPKSEGLPAEHAAPLPRQPQPAQKPRAMSPTPFKFDDTDDTEEGGEANFPSEPNSGQLS